ncbi:MAG: phosphohydrolase, partial [Candidatus Nanosynbacter sp.]|nr:phosphohydrolase [Candidatus Nanosynbacter sp.]
DYDQFGDKIWHRFNASKQDILWYYRAVFDLIRNEPVPIELKRHLANLIEELKSIVTANP